MTTKERPIIFDGESVRAILAGTKTQTRRVVKHPTINRVTRVHSYKGQTEFDLIMGDESGTVIACPYGRPGDRLWVREVWTYFMDGLVYRAATTSFSEETRKAYGVRWQSPIHMPRTASRITLEITDVRVQRVQEISEIDCEAELGVKPFSIGSDAYTAFMQRWNAINNKRGYSWMMNPWVWVVEFKVI